MYSPVLLKPSSKATLRGARWTTPPTSSASAMASSAVSLSTLRPSGNGVVPTMDPTRSKSCGHSGSSLIAVGQRRSPITLSSGTTETDALINEVPPTPQPVSTIRSSKTRRSKSPSAGPTRRP